MVERNLAKVEVAGPSPVFRSKKVDTRKDVDFFYFNCLFAVPSATGVSFGHSSGLSGVVSDFVSVFGSVVGFSGTGGRGMITTLEGLGDFFMAGAIMVQR